MRIGFCYREQFLRRNCLSTSNGGLEVGGERQSAEQRSGSGEDMEGGSCYAQSGLPPKKPPIEKREGERGIAGRKPFRTSSRLLLPFFFFLLGVSFLSTSKNNDIHQRRYKECTFALLLCDMAQVGWVFLGGSKLPTLSFFLFPFCMAGAGGKKTG